MPRAKQAVQGNQPVTRAGYHFCKTTQPFDVEIVPLSNQKADDSC
jgi:hypothetical protein